MANQLFALRPCVADRSRTDNDWTSTRPRYRMPQMPRRKFTGKRFEVLEQGREKLFVGLQYPTRSEWDTATKAEVATVPSEKTQSEQAKPTPQTRPSPQSGPTHEKELRHLADLLEKAVQPSRHSESRPESKPQEMSTKASMVYRLSESIRGHSVAFSPDGKTLASVTGGNTITLWDVTDPRSPVQLSEPLSGHEKEVRSVAFSPRGKLLASGSDDETTILWDVTNPRSPVQLSEPLRGHEMKVRSVAFSPDGKTLASGSNDCTIILWDVTNPRSPVRLGKPLRGHTANVESVAFSSNGKILASFGPCVGPSPVGPVPDWNFYCTTAGGAHNFILWDVTNPRSPVRLEMPLIDLGPGGSAYLDNMALSSDGRMLATMSGGDIILWDVANARRPHWLVRLVTKSTYGAISGWNMTYARSWPLLVQLDEPSSGFFNGKGLAFSPDGKTLASGSNKDTTIILWDMTKLLRPLNPPFPHLVENLWDITPPPPPVQLGERLTDHKGGVSDLAFSPDGKILASAGGTISLWDVTALVGR